MHLLSLPDTKMCWGMRRRPFWPLSCSRCPGTWRKRRRSPSPRSWRSCLRRRTGAPWRSSPGRSTLAGTWAPEHRQCLILFAIGGNDHLCSLVLLAASDISLLCLFISRARGTSHCLLFTVAHNLFSFSTKTVVGTIW